MLYYLFCWETEKSERQIQGKHGHVVIPFAVNVILERLRMTFTANGKREIWPRDHVYPIFTAYCFQFLCQIE